MKWKKPSGMEIETNDMDETIEYCKSLGWEMVGKKDDKPKAASIPMEDKSDKPKMKVTKE